uniref:Uncharacterized protein n=1 Tax=Panagrolaimus sp. ES5 TaxID=591445 RepID=A0AC34GF28_9BILA
MDSTNEYLIRAGQRNKILGDLDTSVMSEIDEQENSNESSDISTTKITEKSHSEKADTNKPYTNDSEGNLSSIALIHLNPQKF